MPFSYSLDLRQKVVTAIDNGMGKTEASRVFQLSRNTIDLWLKRRDQEGTLETKVRNPKRSTTKIRDLDTFQAFVTAHNDWSQKQMGDALGVSASCVGRALKKLGYSKQPTNAPSSPPSRGHKSTWQPSTQPITLEPIPDHNKR